MPLLFHRLTKEDENATTELLANLMQRKYIRDAVLRFLVSSEESSINEITQKVLDRIQSDAISTQISTREFGQPDLIVSSDEIYIVVENKIRDSTVLQQHEITDYVKLAERYKDNYLVFLIPQDYQFKSQIESIEGGLSVKIRIRTWEELISYLESLEIESPIFRESIEYFKAFFPEKKDLSLSSKEVVFMFKPEYYFSLLSFQEKLSQRFAKIKESVIAKLNEKDYGEFKALWKPMKNEGGIGEWIHLENKNRSIFFGLNNPKDFDANNQNCVYSVCFWDEYYDCDYLHDFPRVIEGKWGWRCVPFFNEEYTEILFVDSKNDELLAQRIVDIICNVCESLKNKGKL